VVAAAPELSVEALAGRVADVSVLYVDTRGVADAITFRAAARPVMVRPDGLITRLTIPWQGLANTLPWFI